MSKPGYIGKKILTPLKVWIRQSSSMPDWLKYWARHKVAEGCAMARIHVAYGTTKQTAQEWLKFYGEAEDIFPTEIPMKTFKLSISPQSLYREVSRYAASLK